MLRHVLTVVLALLVRVALMLYELGSQGKRTVSQKKQMRRGVQIRMRDGHAITRCSTVVSYTLYTALRTP